MINLRSINSKVSNMGIRQSKHGSFEGRVTMNGKTKSFYGKTKAIVKEKARDYLMKLENGYFEPDKVKLAEYMEYWLRTYKCNTLEPSSYARLWSLYKHQIKDGIGKMMIGNITEDDIQKVINEYANPKKPDTKALTLSGLQKLIQILRPCFEKAVQEGKLFKNPCNGVYLPKACYVKKPTKKQFSLTDEEINRFREAAIAKCKTTNDYSGRDGLIMLIIINLGLRVGEVLALKWDDIDFKNKYVKINKTVQSDIKNIDAKPNEKKYYSRIKDTTKTKAGERSIPLNDNILAYLQELREYDSRKKIKSEYVACNKMGNLHRARNLQRSLDKIVEKAGIDKKVTLHTLRHTYGSYLIRRGAEISVVSKLMGHSRIMITYDKYIHTIQEEEVKAMNLGAVC